MLTIFAIQLIALLRMATGDAVSLSPRASMRGAVGRHIEIRRRTSYVAPLGSLLALLFRTAFLPVCVVVVCMTVKDFVEAVA